LTPESVARTPHTVILLLSAQHVVRAESRLNEVGIECKLIPVPRHISSECGVCLRVATSNRELALNHLAALGMKVVGAHNLDPS
jgi:hypothetical protein